MEEDKRKLQIKLWLGAVFGSIIAFLIVNLLWKEANSMLLLVFLIFDFQINLCNQGNKENGY